MITDGECSVSQDFTEQYEKEVEELAFRHYGCLIGVRSHTLEQLCDEVYDVRDLGRADETDVFSYV